VEALRWVIGDAGEDVGEPGLRIDVVQLRGHEQGCDRRGAVGTPVGAGEQPGFSSEGEAAQRALGRVVEEARRVRLT
jgi:hypothetical protein